VLQGQDSPVLLPKEVRPDFLLPAQANAALEGPGLMGRGAWGRKEVLGDLPDPAPARGLSFMDHRRDIKQGAGQSVGSLQGAPSEGFPPAP